MARTDGHKKDVCDAKRESFRRKRRTYRREWRDYCRRWNEDKREPDRMRLVSLCSWGCCY